MSLDAVTLRGLLVTLVPLERSHVLPLAEAGLHPRLWRLQPKELASVADMAEYVDRALAEQAEGVSLPFTIVRNADEMVIGSTRYMDIAAAHCRLEIGATWFRPDAQRTGANVEAKLLLLAYAFDTLLMQKVVFKTELQNTQSRAAILALGAVEEGTFRQHLIAESGRSRDMVYYAMFGADWPTARSRLRARLHPSS